VREVAIPAVGFAMTEAVLLAWAKQPGDAVSAGDVVAEIETDKTTAELEAPASGILGRHRFAPGDVVPVGTALTVILVPGEVEAADPRVTETPTATGAGEVRSALATPAPPVATASVAATSGRPPQRESPRQRAAKGRSAVESATPASAAIEPLRLDGIAPGEALRWLREMVLIRDFEGRVDPLVLAGKIAGGAHLSLGQEAVAVGVASALRPGDLMSGTHRSHHHALAMGIPATILMAELFGRAPGTNGGRGGSMHVTDPARGFIGGNGIVGAGLGIALGAALSANVRRSGQIAIGFVGDGGVNTGRTWESVNLATVWKLPLVIVCENNLYAVETATAKLTSSASIVERAAGFGIRAEAVDGQDVAEVHRAVASAAERARAGEGPTFLEARTYRYEGHSTGQAITYRTDEEVATWRTTRDPISRMRVALTEVGALDDPAFEALESSVRDEVDAAVAFADAAPWPDTADVTKGVTALGETVRRLG